MALQANGQFSNADRGAEPYDWHHSLHTPAVVFTWHHTIPWNVLRLVWNELVRCQYWDALKKYMSIIGISNGHEQRQLVNNMKRNVLGNLDDLHTKITWQGWNIVEGPGGAFRATGDDPGAGRETWITIYMSHNHSRSISAAYQLHSAMVLIANGLKNIPDQDRQCLNQFINAVDTQKANLSHDPIKWNRNHERIWVYSNTMPLPQGVMGPVNVIDPQKGRVNDKYPGVWVTPPVWRKRTAFDDPRME
jgi:hypothetical protein